MFLNANVWMLAQPFGYPSALSSYGFVCPTGNLMGLPSDAGGVTRPVTCAASLETAGVGDWVQRAPRSVDPGDGGSWKVAAGTEITNWWDDGGDGDRVFPRGPRLQGDRQRDRGVCRDRDDLAGPGHLLRPAGPAMDSPPGPAAAPRSS
ncbi:MAG: hypothetical protein R2882_15250 [Gemmatimonadales bacterium]